MASESLTISVMGSDDTSAGLAPGVPTTIHEPLVDPEPALAYSEAVELPDLHRSSRLPVVLFAGAVAALVAAAAAWFLVRPAIAQNSPPDSAPWATSSQAAPPAAAAAEIAPDPLPQQVPDAGHLAAPTADDVYITQLIAAGITINDRDGTIHNGHVLCEALATGQTDSQIVPALRQKIPSFTVGNAEGMLGAAVAAYCPQYASRLGTY